MRLILPCPAEGMMVTVDAPSPLPADLAGWRLAVLGETPVASVERTQTEAGWDVTIVQTLTALHAFFELFDRGVHVVVTATDAAALTGARALLLAGDIDRAQDEVVCLAQLWESG